MRDTQRSLRVRRGSDDACRYGRAGHDAIVFVITAKDTGVCSFTWFIEAHSTSFYIKSTMRAMQVVKVSLHGPDPNRVGKEHFRLDFTNPSEARRAVNAGAGWAAYGAAIAAGVHRPADRRRRSGASDTILVRAQHVPSGDITRPQSAGDCEGDASCPNRRASGGSRDARRLLSEPCAAVLAE